MDDDDEQNEATEQPQDQSDVSNEIGNLVTSRVAEYSNTALASQVQHALSTETNLNRRGSLHRVLQNMSEESHLEKPGVKQSYVTFKLPEKEYVISGEEDKLLDDAFVRKLPISIQEKRFSRHCIQESLKKKQRWDKKVYNYIKLKYKNFLHKFDFWSETLAIIEGQHGAAIVSYFLFIRWLLYMNIVIFILNLTFIVLPQFLFSHADTISSNFTQNTTNVTEPPFNESFFITHDDQPALNITNTTSKDEIILYCKELYFKEIGTGFLAAFYKFWMQRGFLAAVQDILQGTGPLEPTYLFIGYYSPFNITPSGGIYDVAIPFLCVFLAMFVFCIIMMVKYSSIGIQEFHLAHNTTNYYANQIFCAWDYSINDEASAKRQKHELVLRLKTSLHEDRTKKKLIERSTRTWLKVYFYRFLISAFIFLWLLSCLYIIYIVAVYELQEMQKHHLSEPGIQTFIIQFGPSITIVILNGISPALFDFLAQYEDYFEETKVNLSLFRNVSLYLTSIIVLVNTVYQQIACKTKDICGTGLDQTCRSPMCWETYVGQQLFKLSITNLSVYIGLFLFYDKVQHFITHRYDNLLTKLWGHPLFFLPTEVLALINSQTILWLGVFYSPLLPGLTILKLIIVFLLKKHKVLFLIDPAPQSYRTSRFNSVFMTILIFSFFFVMLLQFFMFQGIPPSRGCGPFRYFDNVIEAVPSSIRSAVAPFISHWTIIFVSLILCFVIHYYLRVISTQKELTKRLRNHLVLQSLDKQFLLKSISDLVEGKPDQEVPRIKQQ